MGKVFLFGCIRREGNCSTVLGKNEDGFGIHQELAASFTEALITVRPDSRELRTQLPRRNVWAPRGCDKARQKKDHTLLSFIT